MSLCKVSLTVAKETSLMVARNDCCQCQVNRQYLHSPATESAPIISRKKEKTSFALPLPSSRNSDREFGL